MQVNFCPECGHRVYQHDAKGCVHKTQVHHLVRIEPDGFTVKHPLAEREQDKLFDCTVLAELTGLTGFPHPGDYATIPNENGGWSFEPPGKATETCDCTVSLAVLNLAVQS